MIILCPHCRKPHSLPEGGLPGGKAATRCKGCGRRFILVRGEDGLKVDPGIETMAGDYRKPGADDDQPATTELLALSDSSSSSDEPPEVWAGPSPVASDEAEDNEEQSSAEEILRAFPQLRTLAEKRFSLKELFSPARSGDYQTRLNRYKARLLLATSSLLSDKILLPGEKVVKIARGSAYFPFEIPYANGLLTLPTNYYALVCTSHRLLLINLDFRCSRPVRYTFQILYDEIAKISRGLFGSSLIVKVRNGGKWNFTTVKRALARELVNYIKAQTHGLPSGLYDGIPRRQLCPSCLSPLSAGLYSCPACQVSFKTAREALKRSLLLPGMGQIYLDHYLPGISILTGYLLVWLAAVVLIIVDLAGGAWSAGLLILSYHLIAGLMARRLGGKGYLADPLSRARISTPAFSGPAGPELGA